jgi:hypothetical protein
VPVSQSWTRSGDVKFWDAKIERLLSEVGHLLPCSPKELLGALDPADWPPSMATNTLAYGEGRWLYFRVGLWWPVRRARS